jgi:hypothetical protein
VATPVESISIGLGVMVPAVTIFSGIIMAKLSARDKKIEVLQEKMDLKDEAILELKIQNSELKVTGMALNRFLSQLPHESELHREIGT